VTTTEFIAKIEGRLRPIITKIRPTLLVRIYSNSRRIFIRNLVKELPAKPIHIPETERLKLWDMEFGCGLFNAAGMFKYGEGYELCVSQGAGAYLAGTTTSKKRDGNYKDTLHPFISYPKSGAASNWMGLPNEGHSTVAGRLAKIERKPFCPIGISVSADPGESGIDTLKNLVEGMNQYVRAGVDFIELNESCPNVPGHVKGDGQPLDKELIDRLEYVSREFLRKRSRNLPVIIKLSTDTDPDFIPAIIDTLTTLQFDGVNFGNTSTNYEDHKSLITDEDKRLFDFFVARYGGGVSGRPLKKLSLNLSGLAVKYLSSKSVRGEFHIIRTGGIESPADLKASAEAGVLLNQWFTGYFENFSRLGHRVYSEMLGGRQQ